MNTSRKILVLAAFFAARIVSSQDFGFDAAPAGIDDANKAPGSGPIFSGEVLFDTKSFIDAGDPGASAIEAFGQAKAGLNLKGPSADLNIGLRLSREILSGNPGRIIDEASVLAYLGSFIELQAGLLKVTWGKGDSLNVLDVINPTDYSDFVNPSPADMKIAQPMLCLNARTSATGKLELVYLPFFEADVLPLTGRWTPKEYKDSRTLARNGFYKGSDPAANGGRGNGAYYSYWQMVYSDAYTQAYPQTYTQLVATLSAPPYNLIEPTLTTTAVNQALALAQTQAAAAADSKSALIAVQAETQAQALTDALMIFPDTRTLEWSQGGVRYTESLGGLDLGLQYFSGFLRTPVYDADPSKVVLNGNHVLIGYDRFHQFGFDAAFVLLGINLRAEAAYNLTNDLDGKNRLVQNPSLAWTAGFDKDLLGFSLNLQTKGSWTLYHDRITEAYDVQAGQDEVASLLAARLGYKLFNDKVELEAAGSYDFFNKDFLISPAISIAPIDDLKIKVSGKYFGGGEDTRIGQYKDNNFVELSVGYSF